MSKPTLIGIHLVAFVIGTGLGTLGWLGLIPIACLGAVAGFVLIGSKSMGMPNKATPGVATFLGSPVLMAAFGWFAIASQELGLVPTASAATL